MPPISSGDPTQAKWIQAVWGSFQWQAIPTARGWRTHSPLTPRLCGEARSRRSYGCTYTTALKYITGCTWPHLAFKTSTMFLSAGSFAAAVLLLLSFNASMLAGRLACPQPLESGGFGTSGPWEVLIQKSNLTRHLSFPSAEAALGHFRSWAGNLCPSALGWLYKPSTG